MVEEGELEVTADPISVLNAALHWQVNRVEGNFNCRDNIIVQSTTAPSWSGVSVISPSKSSVACSSGR
jgi:hypothetical protein